MQKESESRCQLKPVLPSTEKEAGAPVGCCHYYGTTISGCQERRVGDSFLCGLCGEEITEGPGIIKQSMQIDHVVPLSIGGETEAGLYSLRRIPRVDRSFLLGF